MAGIDNLIQERVDTYSGNPAMLEQRYGKNQDLIDLLALQRLKSEKDAAARQIQMQMDQSPSTVKQQLEQELTQRTLQDAQQQVGAGMQREAGQQKQAMAQRAQQPPPQAMAQRAQQPLPQAMPQRAQQPPPGIAGAAQRYADGGKIKGYSGEDGKSLVTNKRSLEDVAASGETPEYWAELLMRPELPASAKKTMKESMDDELLQAVTAAGAKLKTQPQGSPEGGSYGLMGRSPSEIDKEPPGKPLYTPNNLIEKEGIKGLLAQAGGYAGETAMDAFGSGAKRYADAAELAKSYFGDVAVPGLGLDKLPEAWKGTRFYDEEFEKRIAEKDGAGKPVDPAAGLPAIKPGVKPGVKAGVNGGGIPNLLAKPAPAPTPAPTPTTNTTSLSSAMPQAPETNITAPKLQSSADSSGIAGQVMGEQGIEKPLSGEERAAEGKRIYQQTNKRLNRSEAFDAKKQALNDYRKLLETQQDPVKQRWNKFMSFMLGGAGHTSGAGALAGGARASMQTAAGQKQFALDAANSLFNKTSELYDSDAELGKVSIAEETATLNRLSGDMRNWQSTFASLTGDVQERANKEAGMKLDADVSNASNAMERFSIEVGVKLKEAEINADTALETLKNNRADVLAFGKGVEGIKTWVTSLETEILKNDRIYQNLLKNPQADPALIAKREDMARKLAASKVGPETRKTIDVFMGIMEKLNNDLSNLDPNATVDDKANIANKYMPQGYGI